MCTWKCIVVLESNTNDIKEKTVEDDVRIIDSTLNIESFDKIFRILKKRHDENQYSTYSIKEITAVSLLK